MSKDKTQSHNRIIEAAKKEFLEYGFIDASMRRIASEAGIQVGGLYKHFANKEDMFVSLVEPTVNEMMILYREEEKRELAALESANCPDEWLNYKETERIMDFIYDHFDACKLLICRSQGTRYENFAHECALMEERTTMNYMGRLKAKNVPILDVSEKELHLLVTTNIEAVLQAVIYDFSREEARHYAKTLDLFFMGAWKALFGL